jgi:hypothetical protein
MHETIVVEKCSQVGMSEVPIPFDFGDLLNASTPSPEEIKAAEATPKILKPKFLVWVMSVAMAMPCPPILICQSHRGRVTVRGVNV